MTRLNENELRALVWFAANFPVESTRRSYPWSSTLQELQKQAGLPDAQSAKQAFENLKGLGFIDIIHGANDMLHGNTTPQGVQFLREVKASADRDAAANARLAKERTFGFRIWRLLQPTPAVALYALVGAVISMIVTGFSAQMNSIPSSPFWLGFLIGLAVGVVVSLSLRMRARRKTP